MPQLTDEGQKRLQVLEDAERNGKITERGRQILNSLRTISSTPSAENPKQPGALRQIVDYARQNPKKFASDIYRPTMEIGGGLVGGLVGSRLGPAAGFIGGTLGTGAGKSAADLIDRSIGLKPPLDDVQTALKETGENIYSGAKQEVVGLAGGRALKMLEKPLAKAAGVLGRVQSGVRQQAGERLFQKPEAFISPSTQTVGRELGAVRDAAGMSAKPTVDEIVDTSGSVARRTARNVLKKIEMNEATTPAEMLKAKQAVNKLVEKTPMAERQQRRQLSEASQQLSDALYAISPNERAAAAKYANAALAEEFRRFYPVTKSGDVSLTRTLFLPFLKEPGQLLAAIPTVLGQSPLLAGAEIAGAGAAYKGARAIGDSPEARRGLIALLSMLLPDKETANAQ